jgi:IMP cyclohydrolase
MEGMMKNFEALSNMEYPGRLIIIGSSPEGDDAVMYAITGRSPSSQARRIVIDGNGKQLLVEPTDEKALRTGNPDLLIYPAIVIGSGIAVSNGKQTDDISIQLNSEEQPTVILENALRSWEYEPDEPNYTPRISGCILKDAALSIIRRLPDGSVERACFDVPRLNGGGMLIATYTGVNTNPLPSFQGKPIEVGIPYRNSGEATDALYAALGPSSGEADFRVAAASVYRAKNGAISISIKNRHELKNSL